MTHIAVAGLVLAAGGCNLRSPAGPLAYSSLQPDVAVAAVEAPKPTDSLSLPVDSEDARAAARMPGDPTGRISDNGAGHVDPVAALTASARARDRWETLHPGDLKAHAPVIGQSSGSAGGPNTPAAASISASAAAAEGYDREAAMQNLINGGKSAGKRICNGC